MASKQISRRQKAMTLVPLALVSGAWTASLAGIGSATAAGEKTNNDRLPDGTSVPSQAIEAPANLPSTGVIAPGVPAGTADQVVDSASTSGIPSAALSAYQRAAQIINSADKTCQIPWELVAAIGRVESDHGRYSGNVLSKDGVSEPGIYGIQLNGKNGTQPIQDTDGGELDDDTVWDRAVGPMQFIPSTWQVVKVDADGDGKRNPQDVDDASLAASVYLCSGEENLGETAGQEKAVYRYNHSDEYVDLVLRLMQAYMDGDYTAVPNDAQGGSIFSYSGSTAMNQSRDRAQQEQQNRPKPGGGNGATGPNNPNNPTDPNNPSVPGTGSGDPIGEVIDGVVDGVTGGGSNGGGSNVPDPVKPVVKTLNDLGKTASFCSSKLGPVVSALPGALSKCSARVGNMTEEAANNLLSGSIAQIRAILGI